MRQSDSQLSTISLFTGAGGLDLGLQRAGFSVQAAVEVDPDSQATLRRNFGADLPIFGDVTSLSAAELLSAGGLKGGQLDLLTGGPPCQPFSTAGRRAGLADPRGSLFKEFARLVGTLRPRAFLMENVRGLLSSRLSPQHPAGSVFQVILSEFAQLGYTVGYRLLCAADYGAPQTRRRLILLGSRDGEALPFPDATHAAPGGTLPAWRTFNQAVAGLVDPAPNFPAYPPQRERFIKLVPEGGNWRSLPPEMQPEAMGGAYHAGGGKVGFYRRLHGDKPAPTVTTSPAQKATDMCHPKENRPISVRESARLQGFPDDWAFTGGPASQYRQIGNAVPVDLALALGQTLARALSVPVPRFAPRSLALTF